MVASARLGLGFFWRFLSIPVSLVAAILSVAGAASAQQPPETLPFFWPDQAFENHGVDNINLYNGDDGINVPLGPAYTLGPSGYQYQLTAFHSAKFWHFSAAACPNNSATQFAWVAGDPTLGVGWSLLPGYVVKRASGVTEYYPPNGGVVQVTLPTTSPYSVVTSDGSHLRITGNSASPTSYTVEFPDGTVQTMSHAYAPPVSTTNSDFSNADYSETPERRYGLKTITDRFGNSLITVTWASDDPLQAASSQVQSIALVPFTTSITFSWTTFTPMGGSTYSVLDHIVFPAPGSQQLNVKFAYQNGSFARDSFDTSSGSGCVVSPALSKVPELSSITFSDVAGTSMLPFSYSMTYLATPGASVQKQGAIATLTLPNGGQVAYDYCVTSLTACSINNLSCAHDPKGARASHCDPSQVAETPEPGTGDPDQPNNPHPQFQNFLDKSPAVAKRTEIEPYANLNTITYYDRDQFRGLDDDGIPQDTLVIRRTLVTVFGNQDEGTPSFLRRYYFKVDDAVNNRQAAGIELERQYFDGTDVTTSPLVRTIITCYTGAGGCGYQNSAGQFIDYSFSGANGRTPPTGMVTWYGDVPANNDGGTCASFTTKCSAVQNTYYDPTAGKYDTVTLNSTLPNSLTRSVDVHWTPSSASGHWILDVFDHKYIWDGGAATPPASSDGDTVVRQHFTFDGEGFLQEARTWDSPSGKAIRNCFYEASLAGDGTPYNDYSQTFSAPGEPTSASCGSIPSTGTDGDAFGQSHSNSDLLLTQTNWRQGTGSIGWNSFDVLRDPSTGFITEVHDPNSALKTTYKYDSMGRVIQIQPPGGSTAEWPTTFCYVPKLASSTGLVIVKKVTANPVLTTDPNLATGICKVDEGVPGSGSGPVLGQQLDGFGRVVRELRRNNKALSGGSYFESKNTWYDGAGHVRFVTDWAACGVASGTTNLKSCAVNRQSTSGPGTVFGRFDPFGRSGHFANVDEITTVANWASDFIVDRTDTRVSPSIANSDSYQLLETICINGAWSGGTCSGGIGGATTGAQSATEFDNLGRVTKVTETNPSTGALSTDTTTYSYNVLDQVTQVSQGAQTRSFGYSAFGFLESEKTPEDGCSGTAWPNCGATMGNGTASYALYGSIGNLLAKTDGTPALTTYSYSYDAAGRLTKLTAGGDEYVVNCYDGTAPCADSAVPNFPGGTYPKGRLTRRVGLNQIPFQAALVFDDFAYSDGTGRVSAETTSIGSKVADVTKNGFGLPVTQSWTYNTLGAIANHVMPRPSPSSSSLTVNDDVYTSGFLTHVAATNQALSTQSIVSANYHQSGRLSDYTFGTSPGVTTTIAADAVIPSRPSSFTTVKSPSTTLFQTGAYKYDTGNNVKQIGSDLYGYDGRSRITSAALSGRGKPGIYVRPVR